MGEKLGSIGRGGSKNESRGSKGCTVGVEEVKTEKTEGEVLKVDNVKVKVIIPRYSKVCKGFH